VIVIFFALVMTACILGVVIWKALEAKANAAGAGGTDIQKTSPIRWPNTPRTQFNRADIAMSGMVDALKYRSPGGGTVQQISRRDRGRAAAAGEIGVLDADGEWRYSSLPETPHHNNADRAYFVYHRDNDGQKLRISEPFRSRLTGGRHPALEAGISKQEGSFGGVLTAAIDSDYFNNFTGHSSSARTAASVCCATDGSFWFAGRCRTELAIFPKQTCHDHLKLSSVGYYKIIRVRRRREIFRFRETSQFRCG